MNSTERRKSILNWLDKDGSISLAEMVDKFKVSKMTIHRDLEWLEQRKALKRIHGGAVKIERHANLPSVDSFENLSQLKCLICNRPPSQQLLYTITTRDGERKAACCPHCGISAHLILDDQVAMALTADFLTGRLHSAQHSYYIMGSVVDHCCTPSILTFDDDVMAKRFQNGFGGKIGRFNDALDFLKKDISLHNSDGCPQCASVTSWPK